MSFFADFHIHSPYSRATSKDLSFETLSQWGRRKGITLIGTGDCTHPGWLAEMRKKLEPDENGLLRLKKEYAAKVTDAPSGADVRFIITGEISTIYKAEGKTRKVHHVVILPDLEKAEAFSKKLSEIGNIRSDGRPILGLSSRNLLETLLLISTDAAIIPAHIWTPWFSVLGSMSGYDAIDDCYLDLSEYIFALETGLSSDPAMNWRVSSLDRFTLVSNSDSHSAEKIGREANILDCDLSFSSVMRALKTREGFLGTVEFFPEEGKYHYDGHRDCKISLSPKETKKHKGLCPSCGKPVTVGVMNRVDALADQPDGRKPAGACDFQSVVPLKEVIGEILKVGPASKKVKAEYDRLISEIAPELPLLLSIPLDQIRRAGSENLEQAVKNIREGKVDAVPGYDGEFGKVHVLN